MKLIYLPLFLLLIFTFACNSGHSSKTKVVTIADVGGTPDGVTVTDTGNIYITDIGTGEIKLIDEDGSVTVIEDTTSAVTIEHPDGITSVTSGTTDILYVADTGSTGGTSSTDGTIVKIEVTPSTVTTTEFVDSTVINNPTGIAADNSGNLYVADQETGDIYQITVTAGVPGTPVSITDSLDPGVDLNEPHGLTLVTNDDNSITLYTTDQGSADNNIVRIDIPSSGIIADAVVTELTPDNTGGTETGTVDNAKFDKPHGIAADSNGAVFVCDENNDRVQIITPGGNVITFAGDGTSGDADGKAEDAKFNNPRGLAVNADGDLLVCDYGNGKVKKIIR